MQDSSSADKDSFLVSIYRMRVEQQYIEAIRKRLLVREHVFDGISAITPSIIIFLIGETQVYTQTLLRIAAIMSIIVAISHFFPFHNKLKELQKRSAKIEVLLCEMEICWRTYQLQIISEDEFRNKHKAVYEEYIHGFDDMHEAYKYKHKYIDHAKKETMIYMQEYVDKKDFYLNKLFERIIDSRCKD